MKTKLSNTMTSKECTQNKIAVPLLVCIQQRGELLCFFDFIPEKGLFIMESEPLKRCITVDRSNLVLDDCERPTRSMLWKWVSQHRLFNLGTGTCLGLNLLNKTQPLGTFACDTTLSVLWWRCNGKILQGASQWKAAVTGRLVVVKRNVHHLWKRYNTDKEGPCSQPYEGKVPKSRALW